MGKDRIRIPYRPIRCILNSLLCYTATLCQDGRIEKRGRSLDNEGDDDCVQSLSVRGYFTVRQVPDEPLFRHKLTTEHKGCQALIHHQDAKPARRIAGESLITGFPSDSLFFALSATLRCRLFSESYVRSTRAATPRPGTGRPAGHSDDRSR